MLHKYQKFLLLKLTFVLFLVFSCYDKGYAQQEESEEGWLLVRANLEQYFIVVNDDLTNAMLINRGDSIKIKSGLTKVKIVWQTIHDQNFTIDVKPGETAKADVYISTFPSYPRSSYEIILNQINLQVTTDRNSTVYIDGKFYGKHAIETLLNPGVYSLLITHPEYGKIREDIEVNSQTVTAFARFNKNPSKLPFAAKLLPGAEYIASKRYGRAVVTYVSLAAITANLIIQNNNFNNKELTYLHWEELYQNADNTRDAISFRHNAETVQGEMQQISQNFNLSLLLTGTLYILSTFDSFRKPKKGYKKKPVITFSNFESSSVYSKYPTLTYKYNFR